MTYLSGEELRNLVPPSVLNTVRALLFDWLLIIANFALIIFFPNPIVYVFCFLFLARQQLALAIFMHDASHRRLAQRVAVNDFIGQFFMAAPLFFSMYSYQKLHLKHHIDPLAPDDPDLSLIGGYPISKKSFYRKILRDAFGVSYLKFIRYFIYMARNRKTTEAPKSTAQKSSGSGGKMPLWLVVFSMLFMNGLIFASISYFASPWIYFFFWFLPMVTALQVLMRIRGIAEHAGYSQNPDQRLNARTVLNPIQTFIFAPHNVNYHIEHHLYPAVPYFRLTELHRILKSRNVIPDANIYPGYGKVLSELVK